VWEAKGHAASLVTITVPHDLDDPLSRLVDAERDAWKRITGGAAWQRLKRRIGISWHIIALEFTRGDENGQHPHYHVLLVHNNDLDAVAIAALHAHSAFASATNCAHVAGVTNVPRQASAGPGKKGASDSRQNRTFAGRARRPQLEGRSEVLGRHHGR